MALSNNDLERIREIVALEVRPVVVSNEVMKVTIYGPKGENGMRKSVKDLERWRYYATGAIFVLGSATFWKILSSL